MSGHEIVDGRLRRYPGGWAADCTCTWFGLQRRTKKDAVEEWAKHAELMERVRIRDAVCVAWAATTSGAA